MSTVVLTICLVAANETPVNSPQTVHLFNGHNLDGWYTYLKGYGRDSDPQHVFSVANDMIHISGQVFGCLTTDNEYADYHLVVEFKWGDGTHPPRVGRARDCGVLVHSSGPDGAFGGAWMHSIECQMIEGGTGDLLVVGDDSDRFSVTCPVAPKKQGDCYVFQPGGKLATIHAGRINWFGRDPEWKDVKGFRGQHDVEKPAGEWNRLECIADGAQLTLILNGTVVNHAVRVRPNRGRIQIQSEGAEVFVRRIDLTPLTRKRYRLIYNSDANNMFIYEKPPMTPQDVDAHVDEVADHDVTTFFMCPNFGMTMNYPTKVGDFIGQYASPELAAHITPGAPPKTNDRAIINLRGLIAGGHDPMALIVDRAHARGMEAFITFRPNEVHAVDQKDNLILSRFWKNHPQWRIGKPGDPLPQVYTVILGPKTSPVVARWLPGGLNFAVPEVRAHRLAQLRECCERFNIDGLEIDFQRFPMYFKPGEEQKNIATMTDWMRQVRAMTREVAKKRGRALLLSARIMARPEQNTAIGLDPVTWARDGLVDFLVVSHYLHNDFPLPIKEYRKLLPPGFPLYASIEVAPDAATYRRIAQQLWRDGVDGIMVFNFFTTREGGKEPPFPVLDELTPPAQP